MDWQGKTFSRDWVNARQSAQRLTPLSIGGGTHPKFAHLVVPVIVFLCSVIYPPIVRAQVNTDPTQGAVYVGGVNIVRKNVSIIGKLFLPDSTRHVRAVIVLANYNLFGQGLFYDPHWRRLAQSIKCALLWIELSTIRPVDRNTPISKLFMRNAAVGGAHALFLLLGHLGAICSHRELGKAPLVFWGWSATASFGTTFAESYPKRTVAFVRYHTHRRGLPASVGSLRAIPALLIAGGKNETAGINDAEGFWMMARESAAPWTFAIEPNAGHSSDPLVYQTSDELVVPWIAAVLRLRLPPKGTTLLPVTDTTGWLGNNTTGQIAPAGTFLGGYTATSWLPDQASARAWQAVVHPPR